MSQSAASEQGAGGPLPFDDMDRSDTTVGDLSTGGEAAREALGVDPATGGDVVDDRSTGETTRATCCPTAPEAPGPQRRSTRGMSRGAAVRLPGSGAASPAALRSGGRPLRPRRRGGRRGDPAVRPPTAHGAAPGPAPRPVAPPHRGSVRGPSSGCCPSSQDRPTGGRPVDQVLLLPWALECSCRSSLLRTWLVCLEAPVVTPAALGEMPSLRASRAAARWASASLFWPCRRVPRRWPADTRSGRRCGSRCHDCPGARRRTGPVGPVDPRAG
jgi:hypothetical protein